MSTAAELQAFELRLPKTCSYHPSAKDEFVLLRKKNQHFANALTLLITSFGAALSSLPHTT